MERIFDILFTLIALMFFMPLLVPVMLILRLTGEGEIFFLQERMGQSGNKFYLIKFATMLKESPNIGTGTITVKGDPRVLPFGKFLRKSKINELPQLVNILKGDMSIIGPRPLTPETFSSYTQSTQEIIIQVRPGLSGIGSIVFRSEEELMQSTNTSKQYYDEVIAPYKGQLEEWFVKNQSMKVYFNLILLTVFCVVFPKSNLAWKCFKGLPFPSEKLAKQFNLI